MERKDFVSLFLLCILFISGEVVQIHARTCKTQSQAFTGRCFRNDNCAMACMSEGFNYGYCTTFQRICMCVSPCGDPPVFSTAPPEGKEPPYVREALLASRETTVSDSEKGESPVDIRTFPVEAPGPEGQIINIRTSPVEAPLPRSTEEEKYPFSHSESPEEMSLPYEETAYPKINWATSRPFFHFDNVWGINCKPARGYPARGKNGRTEDLVANTKTPLVEVKCS